LSTAVADVIVIVLVGLLSLLPIVHVMTCTPYGHDVSPERIGWCAKAGNANTTPRIASRPTTDATASARARRVLRDM
jgi:hypothetical protein